MATIKDIVQRPGFNDLNDNQKRIALSAASEEFNSMPEGAQAIVLKQLSATKAPPPEPEEQPGILSRIGENLMERRKEFGEYAADRMSRQGIVQGQEKGTQPRTPLGMIERPDPFAGTKQKAGAALDVAVAAAEGVTRGFTDDIVGELAGTAISKATPQAVKDKLSSTLYEIGKSVPGQIGLQMIRDTGQLKRDWVQNNPDDAKKLSFITGLIGITGTKKLSDIFAAKATGKGMDVKRGIKQSMGIDTPEFKPKPDIPTWGSKSQMELRKTKLKEKYGEGPKTVIQNAIDQAIKPSVYGKKKWSYLENFYDKADNAVRSVLQRTSTLPKNLKQFAESIDTSKRQIWNEVSSMTQQATKAGIEVDLNSAIKGMEEMASKMRTGPKAARELANHIDDTIISWKTNYKNMKIAPDEAERLIKEFNDSAANFYLDPKPTMVKSAAIDAGIADELREALFGAIPDSKQYRKLRKEYGGLIALEKEVMHKTIIDSRKNAKGFFDLVGDWGTGDFVAGLATLDPKTMAKGLGKKFMMTRAKIKNNPNRIISDMFKIVEKDLVKSGELSPINPFVRGKRLPPPGKPPMPPAGGQRQGPWDKIFRETEVPDAYQAVYDQLEAARKTQGGKRTAAQSKALDFINQAREQQGLPPVEDFGKMLMK